MPSYASAIVDLQPRFPHQLTSEEVETAAILLDDASFWLSVWVPGLADEIALGNADAIMAAKLLAVSMVCRSTWALTVLGQNIPPGASSTTDIYGPFQYKVAYSNPEGNLYLYDRELADLLNLLMADRAQAVSMRSPGL